MKVRSNRHHDRRRTLDELIYDTKREIEWLSQEEPKERDPLRLAKIRDSYRIKCKFLAKLQLEQ